MTSSNKRFRIPIRQANESEPGEPLPQKVEGAAVEVAPAPVESEAAETVNWSDAALRLRAEMDNYRKRQQRLADERIDAEKRRLLTSFLGVVDNLERIVAHLEPNDPYQQSIQVTYDEMMKLLRVEGVEPIDATGTPFDPLQHEAVAVVPAQAGQSDDIIVLKEERKGYRLGDHVLRPAQVVVAKS